MLGRERAPLRVHAERRHRAGPSGKQLALPTTRHGGHVTWSDLELTRRVVLDCGGTSSRTLDSTGSARLPGLVRRWHLPRWGGGSEPGWLGIVDRFGLPLVILVLLMLDRRRPRLRPVGFGWTDEIAEVAAVAEDRRRRGVEVSVQQESPFVTFRRRDQRVFAEVLGLPPGRYP